jgi:hypothetical protein
MKLEPSEIDRAVSEAYDGTCHDTIVAAPPPRYAFLWPRRVVA